MISFSEGCREAHVIVYVNEPRALNKSHIALCLSFSCVMEDYQKDVVLSTLTAVIRPVSYSPSQMSILLASVPDWADWGATLTWLVWKLIPEHAGSMQAGLRSSCVAGVEIFLPHSKVSWD